MLENRFKHEGDVYVAVNGADICVGCAFLQNRRCLQHAFFAPCGFMRRTDGRNVIWEKQTAIQTEARDQILSMLRERGPISVEQIYESVATRIFHMPTRRHILNGALTALEVGGEIRIISSVVMLNAVN